MFKMAIESLAYIVYLIKCNKSYFASEKLIPYHDTVVGAKLNFIPKKILKLLAFD